METKTHGMTNKKNALKENKADSFIHMRIPTQLKAVFVRCANGEPLAKWIIQTCTNEVNKQGVEKCD